MEVSLSEKKWNHDELLFDLAEHLRKPERMMWCDMQLGSSGSPRPDVFTVAKSYTNPKPIVYEIKISVSDFRSDITSGKWQSYLKFACGVYFATPSGMITKNDIPKGCGLIVRGDEGWRTLKAPTLHPVQLPQEAMLKLLIDGIDRHGKDRRLEYFDARMNVERIQKKFGKDVAMAVQSLTDAQANVDRLDYQVQQILDSAKHQAKLIRQEAESDQSRLMENFSGITSELCEFFGIPQGSSFFKMREAKAKLMRELSVDDRVDQCERLLSRLERDLLHAREIFPAATAKTEQHSHS